MNRSTQSKGLTLTELLVVVAIVVLVAPSTVSDPARCTVTLLPPVPVFFTT